MNTVQNLSPNNIQRNPDLVKWIITIALTGILLLLPASDFYTMKIRLFFAITVFNICLAAFELLPIPAIGLLLSGAYIGFNVAPVETVMSPWLSTTLYMVLGGYGLAGILEQSGLLNRIAFKMMSKTGSNYMMLLFCIFFTGIVLTIVTFGRGYIILAVLCLGLCQSLKITGTKLTVGICWACMLGAISAKTFVYCVSMFAVITGASNGMVEMSDITFLSVIGHNWPMLIVSMVILFVIGKWYSAGSTIKLEGKNYFEEQAKNLGKFSKKEKLATAFLIILFILLCTESIHGISNAVVFMLLPWLMLLPIFGQDAKAVLKTINFGMMFFIASCLSIGSVAASLGFGDILSENFVSALTNSGGSVFFVFACVFLMVFLLNFVMTPMAIWGLFTVPVLSIAQGLDLNMLPFVYALGHSAEAILLPYEYTPYLIVFSFGMISMKDFMLTSIVRCIIYFAGFLLLLVPYWMIIGFI